LAGDEVSQMLVTEQYVKAASYVRVDAEELFIISDKS
jgi:hypothetical protein